MSSDWQWMSDAEKVCALLGDIRDSLERIAEALEGDQRGEEDK